MTLPVVGGTFALTHHLAHMVSRTNRDQPLGKLCAAIGIKVKGNLLPSDLLTDCWVLFKALDVIGTGRRQLFVSLTGTNPPSVYEVLAETAYEVITAAGPRVTSVHIGEATEAEALDYGRQFLSKPLRQTKGINYKIRAEFPATLADMGHTGKFEQELALIDDWGLEIGEDGAITLDYDTTDMTSGLMP